MTLAFYKVGNSQNYGRHTFDTLFDRPEEVMEMLSKLREGELHCYDTENDNDMSMYQDDHNEDIITDFWCVVVNY